jgi:hypothetical protein
VRKVQDVIYHYRGYWSDGGKCRIQIYREYGEPPVVICSQLLDNDNTSVTNMAEYLAAEVIEEYMLPTPLVWIEHYPEHEGGVGEYSLMTFSSWAVSEAVVGGTLRRRLGTPGWTHLDEKEVVNVLQGAQPAS